MSVALGVACAQCELAYGADWYFCPARWPTRDGYVPFAVVWDAWRTMQSVEAARRLSLVRAIVLAQPAREDQLVARQKELEEQVRLAYPEG